MKFEQQRKNNKTCIHGWKKKKILYSTWGKKLAVEVGRRK